MKVTTSYLNHFSTTKPEQVTLEKIIEQIRSDQHMDLVANISNEKDKNVRKTLKQQLPMWFPTIQIFSRNSLDDDSEPTGIVQFDIDLKDNPNADFNDMKSKVMAIPETIYAFISPSGGLKFGIRTDFIKNDDDSIDSLKQRYRKAYNQCLAYVSTFIDIQDDESMKSIKRGCYISHDLNAYINLDCSTLTVNDSCKYIPPALSQSDYSNLPVTTAYIAELLAYIPRELRHDDRVPINYAVFNSIGDAGIPILFSHWTTSNRTKLKRELNNDAKRSSYGSVGHLINQAKEHGYKQTPSKLRNKLRSKSSNHQFDKLLTVDEGKVKLDNHVQSFFANKTSMFINVSTGFGKTQTVLEILRNIPITAKVLYLVGSHKLADEIKESFYEIEPDNSTFHQQRTIKSRINHIKSKHFEDSDGTILCSRPEVVSEYKKNGVRMPVDECTKACNSTDTCPFIAQFDPTKIKNIRLMTHDELTNIESIWFNGFVDTGHDSRVPKLKGSKWKPDYIIVDEDWVKRHDEIEFIKTSHDSIRNILNDCMNGVSLIGAIDNYRDMVITDYEDMRCNKPKYVKFENTDQYIKAVSKNKIKANSVILKIIYDYIVHGFDEDILENLRFDVDRKILIWSEMIKLDKRYSNVPTLYLDATADEAIVKSVVGDIDFHSIHIKSSDKINVYQLENFCWSKNRLTNESLLNQLIVDLKTIISKPEYKSVGLITYNNIATITDFDEWLAKQMGVDLYAHFLNLRGLNIFEDVDCLLIIGRHMLPQVEILDYYSAIFGGDITESEQDYVDVPIRMKNCTARTLSNRIFTDQYVQRTARHFSISETIQAVGRGRLIHGKPKDIYLFSNESLGSDVEVTDFFVHEQTKFTDSVNQLKQIGFCRAIPRFLKNIGLTKHHIENNRDDIDREFIANGIEKVIVEFTNNQRKKCSFEYFISDRTALLADLKNSGAYKISIEP